VVSSLKYIRLERPRHHKQSLERAAYHAKSNNGCTGTLTLRLRKVPRQKRQRDGRENGDWKKQENGDWKKTQKVTIHLITKPRRAMNGLGKKGTARLRAKKRRFQACMRDIGLAWKLFLAITTPFNWRTTCTQQSRHAGKENRSSLYRLRGWHRAEHLMRSKHLQRH